MRKLSLTQLYVRLGVAAVLASWILYGTYRGMGWLPSEGEWRNIEPRNIGPWWSQWPSLVFHSYLLITALIALTGLARLPRRGAKDAARFLGLALLQLLVSYALLSPISWTVEKL